MVQMHNPALLALLETRIRDHKALSDKLDFNSPIQFPSLGSSRGIVIMWDNSTLSINGIAILPQVVHVSVKVTPLPLPKNLSGWNPCAFSISYSFFGHPSLILLLLMADWGPVLIGVVLFILLQPGLLFQIPGNNRTLEFGSMKTNGKAIAVHTLIFFTLYAILILAVHVHIYTG
ncbi:hypothetical protein FXO37_34440 [Capsicum annuum]|nr:hypothetical protein FXO37_34440 [Capsicum annuum]